MDRPISEIIEQIRPMVLGLSPQEQQDLIEEIAALFQQEAEDDPLAHEQAAWFARPFEDREPYQGEYVAVYDGQVIDHDPDQRELYIRIRRGYGATAVLIVNADWDAPPEFIFRSPHIENV